jgi:thioredoxin-related protein
MKLIKFLLLLSITTTTVFAQNYKDFAKEMDYEIRYDIALEKAKAQKKDIMFVLVTNYCPWCRKFEKRALKADAVSTIIQEKYIPLIINREEHNFPKKFDSARIPVTYFVNYKNEQIEEKVLGYKGKNDFLEVLKKN